MSHYTFLQKYGKRRRSFLGRFYFILDFCFGGVFKKRLVYSSLPDMSIVMII